MDEDTLRCPECEAVDSITVTYTEIHRVTYRVWAYAEGFEPQGEQLDDDLADSEADDGYRCHECGAEISDIDDCRVDLDNDD